MNVMHLYNHHAKRYKKRHFSFVFVCLFSLLFIICCKERDIQKINKLNNNKSNNIEFKDDTCSLSCGDFVITKEIKNINYNGFSYGRLIFIFNGKFYRDIGSYQNTLFSDTDKNNNIYIDLYKQLPINKPCSDIKIIGDESPVRFKLRKANLTLQITNSKNEEFWHILLTNAIFENKNYDTIFRKDIDLIKINKHYFP